MHQIHHTEGFILGSRNSGEADKIFYIYTRDFGLLSVVAKSIRKISSKLRFHMLDYSHINLDLVKGREVWRLTHAEKIHSLNGSDKSILFFIANFSRLIQRLVKGEEANPNLFQHLIDVYEYIEKATPDEIKSLECLSVLRLMHHLGYIALPQDLGIFITSTLDKGVVSQIDTNRQALVQKINDSLKETQL